MAVGKLRVCRVWFGWSVRWSDKENWVHALGLVGARPRVIRRWREGQILGLAELYRRGFWRDSGSWGLGGERQERTERKAVLVGNRPQAVGNGRLELRD